MAKRRANGEGNLRKRKDGRWEGRYTAGRDPETGRAIYKNVLGKTQAEAKAKLKQAIEEAKGLDTAKVGRYTVGQWMEVWFEHYAKIKYGHPPTRPTGATSTTTSNPTLARSPWKNSLLWNCRSSTRSCWSREGQAGWSPGTRPRG